LTNGAISDRLGIVINARSSTKYEDNWEDELRKENGRDCFESIIRREAAIAALNSLPDPEYDLHGQPLESKPKTFASKYPAAVRREIAAVVAEFLTALEAKEDLTGELRRQARWVPPPKKR
jgi:hypothetical protein